MTTLLTKLTEAQQEKVLEEADLFGCAYIYQHADGTVEVLEQPRLEVYFAKSAPLQEKKT